MPRNLEQAPRTLFRAEDQSYLEHLVQSSTPRFAAVEMILIQHGIMRNEKELLHYQSRILTA